jgi:hypothetical protein
MTIARAQMNRQLYGVGSLVEREKYGLGSALKKFAKTFIPKELDPVLQFAAPFLGPVYGPIASVAGSARTGKINPYSLAASTLPYVQFGGAGTTGLESLMPVGYGGSGAIQLPGGALQLGEKGTSLAGALGKYFDIGSTTPYTEAGQGNVSKFVDIINPGSNLTGSERISGVLDLGKQATDAILYKTDPVTGKQVLDKRAAFSIAMAIPSYIDAKKKADELGLQSNEFNEEIYNREKQNFQSRYTSNAPTSSFGIRATAASGGMMEDGSGILSIKLTPREGYLLGDLVAGSGVAIPRPGQYEVNSGMGNMGGGMGAMISKLIQQNPQMFKPQSTSSSTSSMSDFIDIDPKDGIDDRTQRANGGRMNYAIGNEIPMRQNQGGISELDLRAKGGYIPVGIKEKADDVPAMLSKNEFVFTADAVRGAGNGSINKGAQKMYKLMKSLEKKVKKTKVA